MKIKMDTQANVNGTCLQGGIEGISYKKMTSIFGKPNAQCDSYKSDVEWTGSIDNRVFTIYNWKNGKNYCGNEGLAVEDMVNWNIGGNDKRVAELLNVYIERNNL